ncbi:MAG: helix-turn-helix transcriptional regulator [Eubacteriales bacterium]|nr:helix-turn-helix transcriptional regulator [Eubacteriales bacterium]
MTGERLNWLIRTMGISGKHLAAQIGVDVSTVSKWRKNRRVLKYDSIYAKRIASWAVQCHMEQTTGIIKHTLQQWDDQLELNTTEQMEDALRLWLTLPKCPASETASDIRQPPTSPAIQLGLEAAFQAQNQLFHLLRDLPDHQEIIMIDLGAVNWSVCSRSMVEETLEYNLNALKNSRHSMIIIDQLTDAYRPRDIMFQWMPAYLQPTVQTYFYRNPKPLPLRQTVLMIRGHAVLTISSSSADSSNIISSLHTEPEYIRLYESMADSLLADSKPMLQTMDVRELTPFLQRIGQHMHSSHLLYMLNECPTFRNMSPELLDEILRDNQISGKLYQECMTAGQQSTATRTRCESRQLYNLDAIEEAMEQEYIVDYDLSAITGKEIRITREQFKKQLLFIRDHLRALHYTLAIYPFSRLNFSFAPPCNMIVQDDSIAAAWDARLYSQRMYSEEMSIVTGFYQYADSLWEQIPHACREESWCRRRIDALLTY